MSDAPRLLTFLIAGATLAPLRAQIEWLPVRSLPTEASMVLDEARGCIVLAGDAIPSERDFVTWEWDHGDWRDCSGAGSPRTWITSKLAYDPAGRRVLRVASQISGTNVIETWAYDGVTWSQLQPAARPTPRQFFALAHDPVRQRTVLFGGFGPGFQRLDDTWEFDGTTWTQVQTAAAPVGRFAAAMVFDEARQEIVLFGGFDQGNAQLADTWLYDGSSWQPGAPATIPPPRGDHAMAYDRASQRVVMFGGQTADTWEWDGGDWSQPNTTHSPPDRIRAAMATHPDGGVLLYGGYYQRTDLWRYVGGEWYCYHDHRELQEQSGNAQLTYDTARERVLWIGDALQSPMAVWEHDGRFWRDISPASGRPARRNGTAIAFDPARAATVMFGGGISLAASDETWSWDGSAWTRSTPAVRPPARLRHAMAFDPTSQRVLLFGGADSPFGSSATLLGDTWLFDGQSWQQLAPAAAPTPRSSHSMATDPIRGRVLLFGGFEGSTTASASDETWEFAGSAWTRLLPATSPPAVAQGTMAFDTTRDRLVLQGRSPSMSNFTETWEFDGVTWSLLSAPPLERGGAMVYDPRTDRLLLKRPFNAFFQHELFQLARDPLASGSTYGTGCSATGPPPRLSTSSLPYFGNHAFQVEIRGAPNSISLLVLGLAPGAIPIQGCTLLVGPGFGLRATIANSFGFAALSQQVPIVPELRGVHLYFQGAQFDPLAGSFDFSAGLDLVLGG